MSSGGRSHQPVNTTKTSHIMGLEGKPCGTDEPHFLEATLDELGKQPEKQPGNAQQGHHNAQQIEDDFSRHAKHLAAVEQPHHAE